MIVYQGSGYAHIYSTTIDKVILLREFLTALFRGSYGKICSIKRFCCIIFANQNKESYLYLQNSILLGLK